MLKVDLFRAIFNSLVGLSPGCCFLSCLVKIFNCANVPIVCLIFIFIFNCFRMFYFYSRLVLIYTPTHDSTKPPWRGYITTSPGSYRVSVFSLPSKWSPRMAHGPITTSTTSHRRSSLTQFCGPLLFTECACLACVGRLPVVPSSGHLSHFGGRFYCLLLAPCLVVFVALRFARTVFVE